MGQLEYDGKGCAHHENNESVVEDHMQDTMVKQRDHKCHGEEEPFPSNEGDKIPAPRPEHRDECGSGHSISSENR